MKKAEMLNLKIGSKIQNKKGQWVINEISFEVFDKEVGKYMYGSNKCETYQDANFKVDKSRTKVVRFYLHKIGTVETDTLVRESTIKDSYSVVEY